MTALVAILTLLLAAAGTDAAAGRKLYVNKCARCHRLYDPAKYTDADWDKWLGKMRQRSRLTEEQTRLIQTYADSVRPTGH